MGLYTVHSSLQHVQSCYCGLSCWLCCPIHIRLCWISICLLHPRWIRYHQRSQLRRNRRSRPSCRPRSCRRIRRCRKIRRQLCRSCPCLPRERLRLMLMLTTDTTDMPDLMLTVLDTEATDTDTHMLTTERDLLMLSQRPRLMPLSSTEPMDMLVSHTLDTPMVLTHMPTELTHMLMELTTKRSADAEPEADAYYGYYGYARPYSYGYAPYAYGAYPYGYGYA